jgi:uncharacterized membrane protein
VQVSLVIPPVLIICILLYLLIGALGTMFYQSQVGSNMTFQSQSSKTLSFLACLFWTIFWLPAGVCVLAILLLGTL